MDRSALWWRFLNVLGWLFSPEKLFAYVTAFGATCVGIYNEMTPMQIYIGTLACGAIGLFLANQFAQRRWTRMAKSQVMGAAIGNRGLPDLPIATQAQLASNVITNVRVYLSDMVRDRIIIKDKIFDNCQIFGPALLRAMGGGILTGSTFRVSVKAEFARDFVWEVPKERWLVGVIGLQNCVVRNCILIDIAYVGTSTEIASWLKEIRPGPDQPQDAIKS